jgi:hypothetical protein
VDGTGSALCLLPNFRVNSVETVGCCTRELFNPLNSKLNPICHFQAVLGAHHILHVSRIRVN